MQPAPGAEGKIQRAPAGRAGDSGCLYLSLEGSAGPRLQELLGRVGIVQEGMVAVFEEEGMLSDSGKFG